MKTKVELAVEADVARLTLAAEDAAKPATMDHDVLDALDDALARIEKADGVRALVVAAASEKYFVVGANIEALRHLDAGAMPRWVRRGHEVLNRLEALSVPTIARVRGYCLGGGLELAMACDLIVAAGDATFGLPEARLGFVTGWGGAARLAARVGVGAAARLLLTGRRIDADEALRIGLADTLAGPDALDGRIDALLADIRECVPLALGEMKRLLRSGRPAADAAYRQMEQQASLRCIANEETRRRVEAFLARRR